MRRRVAVLFVAALVSAFGAAACGPSAGQDLQRRAEQEARQRAADQIHKEKTQVDKALDEGLTRGQDQVKQRVDREITRAEERVRGETQRGAGGR